MSVHIGYRRHDGKSVPRRRKGFAMLDALLMIFIVMVTLGAVFQSIQYSMTLRQRSQFDLDMFQTGQACFEALEAGGETQDIRDQTTLNNAMKNAVESLGGSERSSGVFRLRNFELTAGLDGAVDIVHGQAKIRIDITVPAESLPIKRSFDYTLNIYGSDPVKFTGYRQRIR